MYHSNLCNNHLVMQVWKNVRTENCRLQTSISKKKLDTTIKKEEKEERITGEERTEIKTIESILMKKGINTVS